MVFNHDYGCRHEGQHSDAAKRLSDTYNLHLTAGNLYGTTNVGKWFAFKLEDGRTDNTLYDSKYDAVIHQHHNENYYGFMPINPSSLSICAAEAVMAWKKAEAKLRLHDRDSKTGGMSIIPRLTIEDQLLQNDLIRSRTGTIAIGNPA